MIIRLFMVFLPFLVSCGGGATPSGFSDNFSYGETNESICYADSSSTCFQLKLIKSDEFGYETPSGNLDPHQYRKPIRAIKLDEVNLSVNLSANFKASEFFSLHKGPIGIFSPLVVGYLQNIRDVIAQPLHITSGYRPPFYNQDQPGAAKWSRHMYGDAADMVANVALGTLAQICVDNGAIFTQLYDSHVHCDWRHEELAEEFFGSQISVSEFRERVLIDLRDKSHILIDGPIESGSEIRITSFLEEQEDPEGILLRQWTIHYPDGSSEEFTQEYVQIKLQSGEYLIKHILGGNIYLEKSITVP